MNRLYGKLLRHFLSRTFSFWQVFGFHIIPTHFYEPVPDTRMLKENLWTQKSELIGININEERQIELLSVFSARYKGEYDSFPTDKSDLPWEYYVNNDFFPSVDSEILYCMIRHFKPRRMIEAGSGNSTYLAAQAIRKNRENDSSYEGELVAIDPYANETISGGFPGLSRLFRLSIQDMPLSEFDELGKDDILFIDSSHVLSIGSDVQYEFLEIIPRLRTGVIVHIHDIFLPAEYPQDWVLRHHRFWTEQYLLHAFLAFNNSFEVMWASSYMHMTHPNLLEQSFGSYYRHNHWPGSFWMRRTR